MLMVLPSVRCGSSQWRVLSGEAEALSKTSCIPSINRWDCSTNDPQRPGTQWSDLQDYKCAYLQKEYPKCRLACSSVQGPRLAEALGSVPGTGERDPVETFKQWLPVPKLLRPMSYEGFYNEVKINIGRA